MEYFIKQFVKNFKAFNYLLQFSYFLSTLLTIFQLLKLPPIILLMLEIIRLLFLLFRNYLYQKN